MNLKLLLPIAFLAAGGARAATPTTPPPAPLTLRVLTYDSFFGKHSLGRWIAEEFKKRCNECDIKFESPGSNASLIGKLKSEARLERKTYDLVIGLDARFHLEATQLKIVTPGKVFAKSPYAIIVDTQRFPESSWPKTWQALPQSKLANELLVEDPKVSGAGVGWLESIYAFNFVSPANGRKLVKRIFPSWSSAYEAFTNNEGLGVWSYLTSEAYHRCELKPGEKLRYKALPLKEGYPEQLEYVAVLNTSAQKPLAQRFIAFLLSQEVQKEIPLRNWMYPAVARTPLPECFAGLPKYTVHDLKPKSGFLEAKTYPQWIEAWSL